MAFYKFALLLAFACLAQCTPFNSAAVNDWQQVLKVSLNVSAADGDKNPLVEGYVTLIVYGDFNKSSDSEMVSQLVQEKLASLQYKPDNEVSENFEDGDSLPLLFSVELKAKIDISVPVEKSIAIVLDVQVYAKKKDHHQALEMVKNIKPSF
ncbi:uncharacterized protein LOC124364471 [Homalodisca vitripennis]|uniref:uncharacterized protein LOC124364471 n=1 Tax=Homalodisca vitripennis TaxID=197043 RepID=UPI001EEBFBB9|nr:uncharacterized protein LOC124364471 [Homalodisca vitripennis]KAG8265808.1 hypothetical protein J6590_086052 [Homalodisca vitripennis]